MRQPSEVANLMPARALLANRAHPLIPSAIPHRHKSRGLPPRGTEAALVELTKLCVPSLQHVRELSGLQEVRTSRVFQRRRHIALIAVLQEPKSSTPLFISQVVLGLAFR